MHRELSFLFANGVCFLDENDESLKRYKESLGIGSSGNQILDEKDPRLVIIQSLGLEVQGRPDTVIDLTGPGAVEQLKKKTFGKYFPPKAQQLLTPIQLSKRAQSSEW